MGKLQSTCWKPPVKGLPIHNEFIMTSSVGPHLDTDLWLKKLDLNQYERLFKKFKGVEDLLSMSERDIKSMGVKNSSHRARMMTSLSILKDKYDRASKRSRSLNVVNTINRNSLSCSRDTLYKNHRLSLPAVGHNHINSVIPTTMEPTSGTEASSEDLKRVLEWELSLDNNDLRSHAWYHGTIPRQRAEELMSEEGEFLIRDCISRPGDYVLTCRWKGTSLHFVINKVVSQPFTVYEKIQYQFEDDCFDTVPDLVTYYVGNKRPISAASGAIVSKPVNRSMPLSYYATRYGLECQMHYATIALEKATSGSDGTSSNKGWSPGKCESRRMSQPSDSTKVSDDTHPSGVSTMPRTNSSESPRELTRTATNPSINPLLEDQNTRVRRCSSGSASVAVDPETDDNPPPKPSRIPSKRYASTTGFSGLSGQKKVATETENNHLYSEPNYPEESCNHVDATITDISGKSKSDDDNDSSTSKDSEEPTKVVIPQMNCPSEFDVKNFTTMLLPNENKPLDPHSLAKMRCMLLEYGPRVIASHLTKADLDVLKVAGRKDMGLGVVTGFELLLLPQGQQMRLDILERIECMKFFVAITILTCGDEEVRSQVLNKWIQIAIETKTALGNLYGFTGIMQGLALSQISRLKSTWLKLRQNYTEIAFTYETKLRPTLKNMQECSNPQAPNTCIPHLMTIILILQRESEITMGKEESLLIDEETSNTSADGGSVLHKDKGKVLKIGLQWESTASDYGLQLLLTHLEAGRSVNQQWQTYRRNSEIVLENAKYDDIMVDIFRTEFHMRFLWGFKGSQVSAKERYSKFLQVLNVMSERCEPTKA